MPEEVKSKTVEVLVDTGSALLCLAGMLVLVIQLVSAIVAAMAAVARRR